MIDIEPVKQKEKGIVRQILNLSWLNAIFPHLNLKQIPEEERYNIALDTLGLVFFVFAAIKFSETLAFIFLLIDFLFMSGISIGCMLLSKRRPK